MVVSFKVSKNGTRYRPKPLSLPLPHDSGESQNSKSNSRVPQGDLVEAGENIARVPNSSESLSLIEGEASFTLNLFPDGYSIGKPIENEANQSFPKLLHPYDRSSESLFLAIESGHLPGDILDDIPAKYIDGGLICEVRDYRRCSSERGADVVSNGSSPTINKVCLKMSLENVVKEIPSITDKSWTYGDLMEVESKIVKALQPKLHLDPTPKLDRLSESPAPTKLNLCLSNLRRKRPRHLPEFAVTCSSTSHGKKICVDRVPESSTNRFSGSGTPAPNAIMQQTIENPAIQNLSPSIATGLRSRSILPDSSVSGFSMMSNQSGYQIASRTPRSVQERGSVSAINSSAASPAVQDIMVSYADNAKSNGSFLAKRENPDGQTSPLSSIAKRMRPASTGIDTMQQQQIGSHVEALQGSDMNWQNTLLQQQAMVRGIKYGSVGIQKFPQQVFEGGLNQDTGAIQFASGQQGMGIVSREEQFGIEKLDPAEINHNKSEMEMDTSNLDPQQLQFHQRLPQHGLMRPNFSQSTWNNVGPHMEKEARKEDQLQKRKLVQSPRLSTGALYHSPLSSKFGEFPSGSVGPSFGLSSMTNAPGPSQKEKTAISSAHTAIGTPSLTSSVNDPTQRQHQAHLASKRRSDSLPKMPAISGVGSPASVGTGSTNANSPSLGTSAVVDQDLQIMLERFSKIETVTMRHQLNLKKNKGDDYPTRKQATYSTQHLGACLSNATNNDGIIDETSSLSKSLMGGSMNVCKMRHLSFFFPERVVQGNVVSIVPRLRTRMIMSEKPSDGTVAMHYGDIDDGDFVAAEDHLPTLPNTHAADLLANQFCSLMAHEGYVKEDDRIQVKPTRVNLPSDSQASLPPNNSIGELQQYGEQFPDQSPYEIAKAASGSNASLNLPENLVANQRMLPPGNPQAFQMSQGLLSGVSMASRPHQLDSQQARQQQQQMQQNQSNLIQQQNPLQRSMMLGQNQLSHVNAVGHNSNIPLGNMLNNSSPLQLQMLQQQQQTQPQMQRKMMMGLGTSVGMGNLRNSIVGLGPMGNPIGMGAARGIPGSGISTPMMSMSGMGSMGQNPIDLSQASNITNALNQQLRSGTITQSQAELLLSRIRMAQNRGSMLGSPQSSIAGMSGARQMHSASAGLSILGQSTNRANIHTLQREIGPMGPPKLMSHYMNQQQQQQNQQQLQLQQQQQQETTSQLKAVVSSPQVGSPSTMGVPPLNQQAHQQASPQQMSQRMPMSPQMSSGAIHATMSAGNPEACPASPQLSSQTLGSVNSITNSSMDMQGVNKSNPVSNSQ
ncbi:PREDICTED: uncharacterized protein LOC109356679 isoform X2 [Lupinus angustifolius]|uniref:uncharacterized protein LOC109347890 isoform X2 n=1 Tax=Lupinus angustifolius TaxID=3871 RepID=UPI00092F0FF4|nr:PREDICTED: uncharacterized protein LOC109347890 isoform X2 [Lupinus angustifolius]XP_019455692.1 PREDICTED: uncharacterized protein LOC109356679 isoform X2 [Lupinus angustifolius]